ncbi:uncharacterized protein [Drosophila kikkawai]|uniref:Uncharacterized protein isoform X2 n=1 Tax=Drosophila kikkawai TaxID=30033 RepID=A0A6P4HUJ9_DROKI|nr:uncharacterized protein LOC108072616 isoform X2 [Drosophila kikkawai]
MPPTAIYISVLLLSLQLTRVSPRSESLKELHKQDESSTASAALQFGEDIRGWAQDLEQLGLDMAQFVEQCRQPGSDCQQRHVLRQLRVLLHGYTELKARLEALEIKYVRRISDQETMDATLRKVKEVLREYDETFHMLKAKTYKLVGQ